MCPLVLELKKHKEIDTIVCLTGQHRELVSQVMSIFKLEEDYNLDIMKEKQTLTSITISILDKLENVLRQERPDIVLVHGDTTTSYAPALGKPVLVVRTETERPEAVEAGTVKVVGVERNDIYQAATELLSNYSEYQRMSLAVSPYGDGHASERIVKILLEHNK